MEYHIRKPVKYNLATEDEKIHLGFMKETEAVLGEKKPNNRPSATRNRFYWVLL